MKFKRSKEIEASDFVEVKEAQAERKKVEIKVLDLRNFYETERVSNLLREGNIVLLRTKELKDKDFTELKRSLEKIKKVCTALNGDIIGIDENTFIACPSFVTIVKEG